MKRIVTFDAPEAGAYDVVEALYPIRSLTGVRSVEVLAATEGSPKYCVIIDVEDAQDAAASARMEALGGQYTGYHVGLTSRVFRKIG